MDIKHLESSNKGSFYAENDGILLAEMTYSFSGIDKFIIEHTQVADDLRGHGIGNLLIDAAVSYARDNKFMILPVCPFAKAIFNRTPAYDDVLMH